MCYVTKVTEILLLQLKKLRQSLRREIRVIVSRMTENYRSNNSQGLSPVCFLNAVEKWEMEE